ncbi:MAG TPA: acyltransferase family protein, partial [Actinotalea sp.]|nr:acyltransferase family protein [Actinotalea sp.]
MPQSTLHVERPPRAATGRAEWVDIAKGLSIALVVLHHVVLLLASRHGAPAGLVELSRTLGMVRMPMFFLASGLFVGRALAGPWSRLLHRRVALFAWLYVLWCVVRYIAFGLLAHGSDVSQWPAASSLVALLWSPASALWFVFALAVFSVVAKALQRVPAVARLAAAAALSAAVGSGTVPVDSYAWRSMALYFVFFLLGADASVWIRRRADALTGVTASVGAVVLGGVLAATVAPVRDHALTQVPGVRLATSLVAVSAGVALAVALSRSPLGRIPAWLG